MNAPRQKRELGRTHAERRRDAESSILQAALKIIATRGLDQLTLAEAGEIAGYSRALPAHYFGNREALIVAVAEQVVQSHRRRFISQELAGGPKGLELLLSAVAFYIDDSRRSPARLRGFYEVLNAALKRPSIAPAIAKLNEESAAAFERQMREAIALGEVRPDVDPRSQAVMLMSLLRGIMSQWLVAPKTIDLDQVRDELLVTLRRSWTP